MPKAPAGMRSPGINHRNADKSDNRLANLEWLSQKDNVLHALSLGLCPNNKGERNGISSISDETAVRIREAVASGATQEATARKFGTTRAVVGTVVRGQGWKHVGGPIKTIRRCVPITEEERSRMADMKRNGQSIRQISTAMDRDYTVTFYTLKSMGLTGSRKKT
jgi:hypothetical protein